MRNIKMKKMKEISKKIYDMNQDERMNFLKKDLKLSSKEIEILKDLPKNFTFDNINRMIENAIGIIPIPLGIVNNFVVNKKKYVVPMATEEPSIIAAANKAAKIVSMSGGFTAECDDSIMMGQIQLISPNINFQNLKKKILKNKQLLLDIANSKSRSVQAKDIQIRHLIDESQNKMGEMNVIEIIVDTKDAMGANVINTMCEAIAPKIEEISNGKTILKILSNYSTKRLVRAKAIFLKNEIGAEIIDRILYAYAFAYSDPYRAVTHNKGVMNGIDSVAIATGQDYRAIESAAHAYASISGKYRSLTKWTKSKDGNLIGEIEIPLAVGVVGGIILVHPFVKTSLKILNIKTAKELAMIMACVGLAQNFSAIRALASEGIQKGHMKLHAKNIAITAGARGNEIDNLANKLIKEGNVSVNRALELLKVVSKK